MAGCCLTRFQIIRIAPYAQPFAQYLPLIERLSHTLHGGCGEYYTRVLE